MAGEPIRVGVTGHRSFVDAASVVGEVEHVLDDLVSHRSGAVEVWSSLAEGADRIVARAGLERQGGTLVAVLPLAPEDYRGDFSEPASRGEFDELLAVAARVEVTGPDASGTRESAYERAGLAIVDHCDVLLALWDGEPSRGRGGTAEIVKAARRQGRDTLIVPVTRP